MLQRGEVTSAVLKSEGGQSGDLPVPQVYGEPCSRAGLGCRF
ncbi:hypothetical protein LINPERPRIM_LOCUS12626 [Linum perenne]